ncbi:MAG: tetratricopeptide repeat protein [Planctomycetaceae bacterium]|nr:tetratricopeptide repeat protein [Planctomycetaceae bacterium]
MNQSSEQLNLKPGDIISHQTEDGDWSTVKILLLDEWPDGSFAAHCMTYHSTPEKPTKSTVNELSVFIWHAPIDAASFSNGWELIDTQPVVENELNGFLEYLKQTDFPRYLDFTEQDAEQVINQANEHYQQAYALGTEGKHQEAIAEYTKAIEYFPLFYEAIDNRAFSYMDLGDYESALNDFESSLQVEPNGDAAFFSKGECLMKLGKLKEAEAIFQAGLERFPEHKEIFDEFLNTTKSLLAKG